jgi:uncharacterized protein
MSYYSIIILPLLSLLIAQLSKVFIKGNGLKPSFKNLFTYSGMPSSHSALIVSLTSIVGFKEGFDSAIFALSFIMTIIVIRDALGIRRYLGQHGHILNVLVKDLKNDKVLDAKYPHLLENIGHTPSQVAVGSLIGFCVSLLGYMIIG